MHRTQLSTWMIFCVDACMLVVCICRLPDLLARSSFPFDISYHDGGVVVGDVAGSSKIGSLGTGDGVVALNSHTVVNAKHVVFTLGFLPADDTVSVLYAHSSRQFETQLVLRNYYDVLSIAILYVIGLSSWLLGVYLLFRKPNDSRAFLLHLSLVSLATVVILAWEGFPSTSLLGFINSVLFYLSYVALSTAFFLFTLLFPQKKIERPTGYLIAASLVSLFILTGVGYSLSQAYQDARPEAFMTFAQWQTTLDYFVVLLIMAGIVSLAHSYTTSHVQEDRIKVRWIFFGLASASLPFLVLTKLMSMVESEFIVQEQFTLPFLVMIPITFAISFLKHKILDIDLIIRKTVQYGFVIGILFLMYTGIVSVLTGLLSSTPFITGIAAVTIAFLFEPLRRKTQVSIDKLFFRTAYNYREAERSIIKLLKNAIDLSHLATTLVNEIDKLLNVERIALLLLNEQSRLSLVAHKHCDEYSQGILSFDDEFTKISTRLPIALPEYVDASVEFEPGNKALFNELGVSLIIPMIDQDSRLRGLLALGRKLSEAKFDGQDIDLLSNTVVNAGLAIERFMLQRSLILKEAEAEKLKEINQLKSDFLSFVSHDLRTPLTSIRVFAELLQTQHDYSAERSDRFLRNIIGGSDRMNRMLSTLLDAQMIESGVKQYRFDVVDLCTIVEEVVTIMSYQLEKQGFYVTRNIPTQAILVSGDRDAIVEAVLNLISNSIKFSSDVKHIDLSVSEDSSWCRCRVADAGVGIQQENLAHIFDKFYRIRGCARSDIGSGIGLTVVRHVMDAHGGKIEVESKVGKGTSFTLLFPRYEYEADNPHH